MEPNISVRGYELTYCDGLHGAPSNIQELNVEKRQDAELASM